jgi:hypothetical protein
MIHCDLSIPLNVPPGVFHLTFSDNECLSEEPVREGGQKTIGASLSNSAMPSARSRLVKMRKSSSGSGPSALASVVMSRPGSP